VKRAHGARGNVSLIALAVVVLSGLLCVGVAELGRVVAVRARADAAADAAALAAAGTLARGGTPAAARTSAAGTAADNGARLVECACTGTAAEVEVEIDGIGGRARAEIGP
jgi:secretion/DNA translocation related TadE-like protein